MKTKTITSLGQAVEFVKAAFEKYPERNGMEARIAAHAGHRRRWPVLYLMHLAVPGDTAAVPCDDECPTVDMPDTPQGRLARDVAGLLAPLDMLNPILPALGLGQGDGTLVTAFGIPLNPKLGNAPAFTRTIEEVLAEPPPDPRRAGLMPGMLERIDLIKTHLPPFFKIGLPDMQGPFNNAHAIVGEDALVGPSLTPESFRALMDRITTYWIASRRLLLDRIGSDYQVPYDCNPLMAECSVNLVGPEVYREHILPHDLRIVKELGPPRIHTCSGPHVFRETLAHLPLIETECGYIPCAVAGYTAVDEAFAAVRGKPILLNIGQEVPADFASAFEMIRKDLDLYAEHPRLTFGYTGMDWRWKDRPAICALHRRLDAYWEDKALGAPAPDKRL